jgi:CheB methylesterase
MVVENLNAKQKISSVVLVAAREGGLDSLGWVFSGLPGGLEAAFIVAVPSYSESTDKLRDIIAGTSGLNIKIVQQKDGLEPDTIHILPTDRVSKSRFALDQERNMQGLIDSFLLSLASDQGEKAIGIILSGLNGDGTLGLTALKGSGRSRTSGTRRRRFARSRQPDGRCRSFRAEGANRRAPGKPPGTSRRPRGEPRQFQVRSRGNPRHRRNPAQQDRA